MPDNSPTLDEALDDLEDSITEFEVNPPAIPDSPISTNMGNAIHFLTKGFEQQVELSLSNLRAASADAATEGAGVVRKINDLTQQMVYAQLPKRAAEFALKNYMKSLQLIEARLETEAKKEAYHRGRALLRSLGNIALSIVETAIMVGAGRLDAALLNLIPKPQQPPGGLSPDRSLTGAPLDTRR